MKWQTVTNGSAESWPDARLLFGLFFVPFVFFVDRMGLF
jgi:hypothetical protein